MSISVGILLSQLFTYEWRAVKEGKKSIYLYPFTKSSIFVLFILQNPFLISNETNYAPYDIGLERDLFIKWPEGLSPDYEIYENDNLLAWVNFAIFTFCATQELIKITLYLKKEIICSRKK